MERGLNQEVGNAMDKDSGKRSKVGEIISEITNMLARNVALNEELTWRWKNSLPRVKELPR